MLEIPGVGESEALQSSSPRSSDQALDQYLLERVKNHEYSTKKEAQPKQRDQ